MVQGQDIYSPGQVTRIEDMKMLHYQDSKGFLWGITKKGHPTRFAGYGFEEIIHNLDPSQRECFQPFHDKHIDISKTITEDQDEKIWISSHVCSLIKYDPDENTIENFQDELAEISGLENPLLYVSYKDQNGDLWWGSKDGIFHFTTASQSFEFYKLNLGKAGKVMSLFEDRNGFLWCRHESGFSKFDSKKKQFIEHLPITEDEANDLGIFPIEMWTFNSTLKLGEQDRFLFLGVVESMYFDVEQKKLQKLSTPLASGEVFSSGFQEGETCILGTSKGNLWKLGEDGNFFQLKIPGLEEVDGSIVSLFEDKQGVIWLGVLIRVFDHFETYKVIPEAGITFFQTPKPRS